MKDQGLIIRVIIFRIIEMTFFLKFQSLLRDRNSNIFIPAKYWENTGFIKHYPCFLLLQIVSPYGKTFIGDDKNGRIRIVLSAPSRFRENTCCDRLSKDCDHEPTLQETLAYL